MPNLVAMLSCQQKAEEHRHWMQACITFKWEIDVFFGDAV